jgi:hypothetical protein
MDVMNNEDLIHTISIFLKIVQLLRCEFTLSFSHRLVRRRDGCTDECMRCTARDKAKLTTRQLPVTVTGVTDMLNQHEAEKNIERCVHFLLAISVVETYRDLLAEVAQKNETTSSYLRCPDTSSPPHALLVLYFI